MPYDFDHPVDRRDSLSLKWDYCRRTFALDDVIPMWVADMDFAAPPAVTEALQARATHPVYGYVSVPDSFWDSVIGWLQRRHRWSVQRSWLSRSPGVVPALSLCVNAFTQPGDKVIVQTPVYYPFYWAIENNGRRVVRNPLVLEDGKFRMDLEALERQIDPRTRMIILCSPHNPVGRVWTREELEALGELCVRHDLIVLSDEIHMDLVYSGHVHTPFASIASELAARTITCLAPSKTFNVAGLSMAVVVASNPSLLARYNAQLTASGLGIPNLFGVVGLEAAYRHGDEWLDSLLQYLQGNRDFAEQFVRERIPSLGFVQPEGTYLALIDCRQLGMEPRALDDFFLRVARVYLDSGTLFGPESRGFERINFGCTRETLRRALERIERAVGEQQ